jgi:ABC-2 type transport system permease protein
MSRPALLGLGRAARAVRAELAAALGVALRYRADFWLQSVVALGWVGWTLIPLAVVYQDRPEVAGWTGGEALLVLGFFLVLEGLLGAFIEPCLREVVEQVRTGTLDFVLLKPVDAQLQVSVQRIAPTRLPQALGGLLVVLGAAAALPTPPGPAEWAAAALLLGAGLVALHGVFTLVISASFWFVRVDNLSYLLQAGLDAGRWPIDVYRLPLRIFLTVVLPVGLMTSAPAQALRGQLTGPALAGALGVCLGFGALGRAVWLRACARYSSASS